MYTLREKRIRIYEAHTNLRRIMYEIAVSNPTFPRLAILVSTYGSEIINLQHITATPVLKNEKTFAFGGPAVVGEGSGEIIRLPDGELMYIAHSPNYTKTEFVPMHKLKALPL